MSSNKTYEKELAFQAERRRATIEFIKSVSDLYYDKSIELVLFRNQLTDRNVSQILSLHEYAGEFVQKPISIFDSVDIAKAIKFLLLPPAKIDIGKLTYEYQLEKKKYSNALAFVSNKLKNAYKKDNISPKDVVLYGFGRIGRLVARELMARTGQGSQLRLRAIVTRGEINQTILEKRASLLRNDSVHGDFPGTVSIDVTNQALLINGTTVYIISSNNPEDIDYTKYGIANALVIDNTGAYRDEKGLGRHLLAQGIDKVLLTAPGKGVPNIVHGVNQLDYDPDKVSIFSAASCTTNAITPVLKAVEDSFGVKSGHIETIHAYTNDQNLLDNFHKKDRRGRSAAINMVITETGAAKAVSKVIPELEGKLTGSAVRVPTPNGSLAVMSLTLKKETSVEEIQDLVKAAALQGPLRNQINYSIENE